MKKLIMITGFMLVSFCFVNNVNSQGIKPAGERAMEQTKMMGIDLKLTATQSANVYNINMYIDRKFDKIKNDNYLNVSVLRSSIKELEEEKEGLMEKVLTYRQFATYLKEESKGAFAKDDEQLAKRN